MAKRYTFEPTEDYYLPPDLEVGDYVSFPVRNATFRGWVAISTTWKTTDPDGNRVSSAVFVVDEGKAYSFTGDYRKLKRQKPVPREIKAFLRGTSESDPLREKLIRMAYNQPELRAHLLPLVLEDSSKGDGS